MEARNPTYNAHGTIDVEINHPQFGWIPFTASPDDFEPLGREIHASAIAGAFGDVEPYAQSQPTQAEIIASYESALDKYLDSVAQRYRYADRTRLALRASYPNEDQALAVAFGTWMDQQCNRPAKQLMQDVIAGIKPQPTLEEFLASLPEFVAP